MNRSKVSFVSNEVELGTLGEFSTFRCKNGDYHVVVKFNVDGESDGVRCMSFSDNDLETSYFKSTDLVTEVEATINLEVGRDI